MKFMICISALAIAASAPAGTYTGSKSILGENIGASIKIDDATHFDLGVTGAATITCASEQYALSGSEVALPNAATSGDCVHDQLSSNGLTLKSITYDSSADSITINVKKSIIGISITLTKSALAATVHQGLLETRENANDRFRVWAQLFEPEFATKWDDVESATRYAAFVANDKIIAEHNAQNGTTYTLGHNQFSALSLSEFKALYLSSPMPPRTGTRAVDYGVADVSTLAKSVDWTSKGAVTPVKNQGQCGSCWAFSTTGSMEGAYQLAGNPLTSFSEQDLVSCASSSGNQGCQGGLMDDAFDWIKSNNGICSEASYPYTSAGGTAASCKKSCTNVPGTTVKSHTDVAQTESALMSAIAKQPVSIAIEADQNAFQLYSSGVLTAACGTQLDHGVLAVGYGTESGTDYFKVKNSWGTTWGMSGYVLLERGASQTGGQCGILLSASYPTL